MKKNNTVLVYGNFNIIHPGHLRLLKYAKEIGKKLVVGIYSDKILNSKKYLSQNYRFDALQNIRLVDRVEIINTNIEKFIKKIKPDIVVKGKEHESNINEEIKVIEKINAKLVFSSGDSTYRSFEYLEKNEDKLQDIINQVPLKYLQRHNIKKNSIIDGLKKVKKLNIIIVGELITDEIINCDPVGMSQESPTLVVSPRKSDKFLGGAGIVAAHCAQYVNSAKIISIGKKDEQLKFLKSKLKEYNVKAKIFETDEVTNNYKTKYNCDGKSLLKVSNLNSTTISKKLEEKIFLEIKKNIKRIDVIIFSDFNYGCLTDNLIKNVINISKKFDVFVSADSQSSSQIGDILKYKNVNLITPTEKEARESLRNSSDGLIELAEKIYKSSNIKNIIIKLNKNGIVIFSPDQKEKNKIFTDKLPAFNKFAIDTSGAGDSFLAGTTIGMKAGMDIWKSSLLGSLMASIQINQRGNVPVKKTDLVKLIKK